MFFSRFYSSICRFKYFIQETLVGYFTHFTPLGYTVSLEQRIKGSIMIINTIPVSFFPGTSTASRPSFSAYALLNMAPEKIQTNETNDGWRMAGVGHCVSQSVVSTREPFFYLGLLVTRRDLEGYDRAIIQYVHCHFLILECRWQT